MSEAKYKTQRGKKVKDQVVIIASQTFRSRTELENLIMSSLEKKKRQKANPVKCGAARIVSQVKFTAIQANYFYLVFRHFSNFPVNLNVPLALAHVSSTVSSPDLRRMIMK